MRSSATRRINNNIEIGLMRPRCITGYAVEQRLSTIKWATTSGRRDTLYPIGPLKTTIIFRLWNCFQIECPTTQRLANYPNPFNPETWIPFELAEDAAVTVIIYDVQGKRIRQLQLGLVAAGRYMAADQAAYWDGKSETGEVVSSGTYFYQIEVGDYIETRKMVILK